MQSLIDELRTALPLIGVAAMGAIAGTWHRGWPGLRSWIGGMLASGFGALMVGFVGRSLELPEGMQFFFAGMIGYSGGALLDGWLSMLSRRMGTYEPDDEAKRNPKIK